MLSRNLAGDNLKITAQWEHLEQGAPTIIGFAHLCALAMSETSPVDPDSLSQEAKTILVAAAQRGTIDIRADRDAFDSSERFLAVCVEYELEKRLLFLQKENPEQTIRFLDGFRQLCQAGLIIHHLQKDFSLSAAGFTLTKELASSDYQTLLDFGVKIEF